jgi:hypothetical protein
MLPSDDLPAPQTSNSEAPMGVTSAALAGATESRSKGQWQPTGEKSHNAATNEDPSMSPDDVASREHLSFEAAVKAMKEVLSGEEGTHLASCARCQSLVQNMRPRPIDSERFAAWATEYDGGPIPSTSTQVRRPHARPKAWQYPRRAPPGPRSLLADRAISRQIRVRLPNRYILFF